MPVISAKPGGLGAIQAEFHLGLAHQIMRYVARMTAEGDTSQLLELGLNHKDIGRLGRMAIPEADRLSRLSGNFLNTAGIIDRDKLLLTIDYLERERVRQETIDTLFHLKATLPLMHQLYAMEREEFVQRRKLLGIADPGGRIRHLTELEEHHVYQLWTQNRDLKIPERLILIGKETRISLGSVYHFLCGFASDEFHEPA